MQVLVNNKLQVVKKGLLYLSDSDMPVAAVAAWRSLEWHVKLLSAQRAQRSTLAMCQTKSALSKPSIISPLARDACRSLRNAIRR